MTTEEKIKAELKAIDTHAKYFVNRELAPVQSWARKYQIWLEILGVIGVVLVVWLIIKHL